MNEVLAWYMYPEPIGTNYSEEELKNPDIVIEVFDYCQILLAFITKTGWSFLINYYGLEKLYELNNISEWLDCETISDFIIAVEYQMSLDK